MGRGPDVHLRESDAFGWTLERDPVLRMTIVAVAVFDGTPDWERFAARMDHLSSAVPMLRQRVVEAPLRLAPPKWVVDPAFDLAWHLRRVRVAGTDGLTEVLRLAARDAVAAFDLRRPLWHATLVEGLAGDRAALVLTLHHMLTDGVGGVQLLGRLFDLEPEGRLVEQVPAPRAGALDPLHLARDAVAFDVRRGLRVARSGLTVAGRTAGAARHDPVGAVTGAVTTWRSVLGALAPNDRTLSPVMTGRGLRHGYDALDVPLAQLRQAAHSAGGSLNDGFLAAVAGGLRHYHERHGVEVADLRVVVPMDVRQGGEPEGGNRISLFRYPLPVGIADPCERIAETRRRSLRWKAAPALRYTEAMAGVLNWLPADYLRGLARHNDLVASNVPGFGRSVYLAGARLAAFYPFGPTSGAAVNVTLMSYRDRCHVAVNRDRDAIPDGEAFAESLRAGFDEVLALAGGRRVRQIRPTMRAHSQGSQPRSR